MALPKVDVPTYKIKLPSNSKEITFRPFTVKEKKLFLLARESKDIKDIVETIKQVIRNCILAPDNIEVDDLPIIDLEFFFVHLRARSEGEVITLDFKCNNVVDEKACGGETKLSFNLLDTKLEKNENHQDLIDLGNNIGVKMKYPTFGMSEILDSEVTDPTVILNLMVDCIEYIYDAEKQYYAKDEKRETMVAWFGDLPQDAFSKIEAFFESSPKIVGSTKFVCSKCAYTEDVKLQGIKDFFG